MDQKVYHFHIPKTAGTSINTWLSNYFHYEKCRPKHFLEDWGSKYSHLTYIKKSPLDENIRLCEEQNLNRGQKKFIDLYWSDPDKIYDEKTIRFKEMNTMHYMIQYSWEFYDFLHGHESLLLGKKENDYAFTVLRNPLDRCFSQYKDYQKLNKSDYEDKSFFRKRMHSLLSKGKFSKAIDKMKNDYAFLSAFSNTQCRVLLQDKYSIARFFALSDEEKFTEAQKIIEEKIDFVGLQDDMAKTIRVISNKLNLPFPDYIAHHNKNTANNSFSASDEEWVLESNQADEALYKYAQEKFSKVKTRDFSDKDIKQQLSGYQGFQIGNEIFFDMNMPMLGDGFLERDAPGTNQCARWSTGDGLSYFYIPIQKGKNNHIKLYIKGWMDLKDSASLKIYVNDREIDYTKTYPPNVAECINLYTGKVNKDWVKISTQTRPALTYKQRGIEDGDTRSKGYSLWRYSVSY